MFFIARIVAAMFTGSCGSKSTTTTDESSDSVIGRPQLDETRLVVPVTAEVCERSIRPAHHELAAPALPPARHLVDDHVECRRERRVDVNVHTIRPPCFVK